MINEFAPYNLAARLKDIGFEEMCFRIWTKDNMFGSIELRADQYGVPIPFDALRAPLYQQCWRWFRENHGLNCFLEELRKDKYAFRIQKWEDKNYVSEIFEDYETAQAACLEKLTELVEHTNAKHTNN